MKKKVFKALSVMLAVVLTFTAAPLSGFVGLELPEWLDFSIGAKAAEYTSGDYTYTLSSDNQATITKISALVTGELELPATLDEYPVVAIGSSAFADRTYITSVVVPSSVTNIGNYAFSGCTRLASVDLGNVKYLGREIFNGCTSLTSITIPNTVTEVYGSVYGPLANSSIKTVVFEEGIANIPAYICSNCTTLTSVTLPEKEDTIDGYKVGDYAFYNTSISAIELPESLTSIGSHSFYGCTLLTEIEIKDNATSIGSDAFYGCSRLATVTLGSNINKIEQSAFYGCVTLTSVVLPDSVTNIGNYAFSGCTRLASVDLGNVKYLGREIFNGCTSLTSITIPNTVTEVYGSVYGPLANSSIKTVVFEEGIANIPAYICSNCTTLTSVTLPEKEDTIDGYKIGNYAFYNCYNLSDVILPLSTTSIGNYAFANCANLGRMTIPSSVTNFSTTAFQNAYAEMHIPTEDSQIALILVDNEIPFTSNETGIKDANDRYLNRDNTSYYSTFSSVSSSGLVTLSVKYDFKSTVKNSISNMKLKIRIPSTVTFAENTVRINGVASEYSLSGNILTINLTNTSGTVTFSVKPTDSTYLTTYALMEYKLNGSTKTETVGIINMATKVLTIDVPEETSKTRIDVKGVASPDDVVTIYVNDEKMGTCTASKVGNYSKSVALKSPTDGKIYTIKVSVTDENGVEKSVSDFVTYNVETVKMTSCTMYYAGKEYDMMNISGSSPVVTWSGGSFTFRVEFENSSIIDELYIVSTKNNEVKKIKAIYDEADDVFVATGFEGYLPGTIHIDYRAANNEYIVNANAEFNLEEEHNNAPDFIKNSDVQIVENNYNEATDTGSITGTIKLDDESKTEIDYSIVSKDVTESNISESELVNDGFTKVKKSDNSYYYIKVSSNGDLGRRVETVEYNIHGQVIRDRVEDFVVKKGVNIFANLPSPYDNLIDVTKGYYDITKKQLKVADIKKQIMEMDISDSEKEERLEALQKMNENATTIKLLSMLSTEVCLITTLVCPPAGIILDFATGIFWSYLNANMDILFNDLTTNLLNVLFRFAVDPSGFIYEAITGNRLSNVKATAFFKTTETEEATLWDATEYEQMNPLYTDANGCYAWDVPEGLWQVKFEKEGYETTYSEWLPVPPPQLEVNIGMNSLSAPEVEYVNVYNDGVEIRFTQYMNIDSINSTNIVITSNGTTISGDFEAIDSGFNYEETEEYAKTFYFTPTKDINGTANVKINNVENYCSAKILNEYNQSHNVTLRIDSMSVEENETAEYKANKNIVVQAYPVEAAAGKIVNVVLSNAYIAEAESTTLTFDENGRATLKLSTLLPGEVDITFEIAETSISAKTKLFVSAVEHISVTGVSINYSSITLTNGETKQLVATVTPEDATNKALLWNSNNENVVKVDENGLITAMSEGVAVVSVTTSDGTYQATCEVEVVASGHNYTTVITVPTCTENGYTTYTCSICGDSYVSDEVSATGHNYDNGNCSVCGDFDPNYTPDDPEYNYTFSIQTPSTTTIRHKDGIKLHANVEGNAPAGSYVEWTASNGKFKTEETNNGNSLKIVSDKNGYTTFTATLYSADGEVLATDSIEMKSKAGFFDKFGSFFRSLFGTTKIYEN